MTRFTLVLAAALIAGGAQADEIEETLEAALDAYRAGDVAGAKEELDYASALLSEMKADGLAAFLPEAPPGWTRELGETQGAGAAFFGGGLTASAIYVSGSGAQAELTLMADNPLVASVGAMLANPQMMAMQGDVRRVGRQRYVATADGEFMALVDNRVLVQLSGGASEADKTALFEAIDFAALKDF